MGLNPNELSYIEIVNRQWDYHISNCEVCKKVIEDKTNTLYCCDEGKEINGRLASLFSLPIISNTDRSIRLEETYINNIKKFLKRKIW